MKFVLFVEGFTEKKAVAGLLKRWLDARLQTRVGIQPHRFEGWAEYVRDVPGAARRFLTRPEYRDDVIAAIGLLDLYGPDFYPPEKRGAEERSEWAKQHIEHRVGQPRFRQFFAVHELEAWLLSAPELFPEEVRKGFPGRVREPETVDFDEPPKKLLQRLYRERRKIEYSPIKIGGELFNKLDPEQVRRSCPNFRAMLDEMLKLAREAGL